MQQYRSKCLYQKQKLPQLNGVEVSEHASRPCWLLPPRVIGRRILVPMILCASIKEFENVTSIWASVSVKSPNAPSPATSALSFSGPPSLKTSGLPTSPRILVTRQLWPINSPPPRLGMASSGKRFELRLHETEFFSRWS